MNDLPESSLVSAVIAGDVAALGRLLESNHRRLYNVALRMVGNADDAAEITQDAMVKIIEHVGDFQGKSHIGTWMIRIVMNLSISHLRKRRLRYTVSLDNPGSSSGGGGTSGGSGGTSGGGRNGEDLGALRHQIRDNREPGPEHSVQQREMFAFLEEAMDRLDDDFRGVLVLRDIDEMDYQQIAEVLSIPVGTVKSRLFRARLALRQEMYKICPPTPGTPGSAPGTPGSATGGATDETGDTAGRREQKKRHSPGTQPDLTVGPGRNRTSSGDD